MIASAIHSEEGWEAFVRGMRSAFSGSPEDLVIIGVAFGVVALIWINWKVARGVQSRLEHEAPSAHGSHRAHRAPTRHPRRR